MEKSQQLLDTFFAKLSTLGSNNEAQHLFPNGIESIVLEVSNNEGKEELKLNIKAASLSNIEQPADQPVEDMDSEHFSIQFNAEGHRVIAHIAKLDMQANAPELMEKVQSILDKGDRTLEEAATFPDDIRSEQPNTKPFHFVDIPFQADGPATPPFPGPPNVITKIAEFTDELKQGNGDDKSKVDALSWIFHLFGDIHQPLHCIEHISDLHPGGDRGGNSFKLKGKAKNLHSAWDSSVNVSQSGMGNEELASDIVTEHPRSSLQTDLQKNTPEKWARASFQLAKDNAYSIEENPSNPPKLTAAYLKNMEQIGRKQAALAGYRLADRLKEIFG